MIYSRLKSEIRPRKGNPDEHSSKYTKLWTIHVSTMTYQSHKYEMDSETVVDSMYTWKLCTVIQALFSKHKVHVQKYPFLVSLKVDSRVADIKKDCGSWVVVAQEKNKSKRSTVGRGEKGKLNLICDISHCCKHMMKIQPWNPLIYTISMWSNFK